MPKNTQIWVLCGFPHELLKSPPLAFLDFSQNSYQNWHYSHVENQDCRLDLWFVRKSKRSNLPVFWDKFHASLVWDLWEYLKKVKLMYFEIKIVHVQNKKKRVKFMYSEAVCMFVCKTKNSPKFVYFEAINPCNYSPIITQYMVNRLQSLADSKLS